MGTAITLDILVTPATAWCYNFVPYFGLKNFWPLPYTQYMSMGVSRGHWKYRGHLNVSSNLLNSQRVFVVVEVGDFVVGRGTLWDPVPPVNIELFSQNL